MQRYIKKFIFQQFLNIFFKNFYENVKNIAPPIIRPYTLLYINMNETG